MAHEQGRFLELFLAEQDVLRAFVRAVAGGAHEADELFQEVSGVLWEAFPRFDPTQSFRPWAIGVARLEALKWRQRHARRREVLADDLITLLADTAAQAEADDGSEGALAHCLERLSVPARDLMHRHYLDDQPIATIASATGRTVAAIEMALVRTRRLLRACVDGRRSTTRSLPARPLPEGGSG